MSAHNHFAILELGQHIIQPEPCVSGRSSIGPATAKVYKMVSIIIPFHTVITFGSIYISG